MPLLPLPSPSRWYAKDSYGRGDGLATTVKDAIFKQPYLPVVRMPPSSTIKGSDPDPPATTGTNPSQCNTANCINHVGCFNAMTDGVRAVPTAAVKKREEKECSRSAPGAPIQCTIRTFFDNKKYSPQECAAAAKRTENLVFSMQVSLS